MSNSTFIKKISLILGKGGWIDSQNSIKWQRDWLNKYGETPIGVARPLSTKQVSEVIILCNKYDVHIVPQGGNTGLVGGSVVNSANGLILSLDRMDTISSIDIDSGCISTQAGVILENLHKSLSETDFTLPMHLGSEGSAQIGGLIASNAGGSHAFRYGMMQDLVIGLEVVLPDGSIWNGMRKVQKDNAGYQLRKLFCGSEGTLGVITQAVLRLHPKHTQNITTLLSVKDAKSIIEFSKKLRLEGDEFLTSIEFFSNTGLDIALKNIPELSFPLKSRSSFYILFEAGSVSKHVCLQSIFTEIVDWGVEQNLILDGTFAMSEAQRKNLWRLRDEQPEGQRRLGKQLKHDISVPPGKLAEFLERSFKECTNILDGVQINPFGHVGDGNVHYNLSPPDGERDFSQKDQEISLKLAKIAFDMGGSFAAEHGIGRSKIELKNMLKDEVEINLMSNIKKSIDKNNSLNPDVLFLKNEKEI